MKLADMMSSHYERTITSEELNDLRISGNAKKVFEAISNNFFERDRAYGSLAQYIFSAVQKHSSGFVVEIAKKAILSSFPLSEKQTWCLSFSFLKISHQLTIEEL